MIKCNIKAKLAKFNILSSDGKLFHLKVNEFYTLISGEFTRIFQFENLTYDALWNIHIIDYSKSMVKSNPDQGTLVSYNSTFLIEPCFMFRLSTIDEIEELATLELVNTMTT